MIRRVDSNDVDFIKLRGLQLEHENDIFSDGAYFEALCSYWCLLVLDDYRGVLIVPFNKKLGFSWVVTPWFYRASAWLGAWTEEDKKDAINFLCCNFKSGVLNLETTQNFGSRKIYQCIEPEQFTIENYSTLAKRMIKKAEGQPIVYVQDLDIDTFVDFLKNELGQRIDGMDDYALALFKKLVISLQKAGLIHFEGAVIGGELVGGIITIQKKGKHLYLKGTATSDGKKKGVFYALMHRAILKAVESNSIFDFGGSEVAGVAQFNHNFGAQDAEYCNMTWGKKPVLYNIYTSLKKIWK